MFTFTLLTFGFVVGLMTAETVDIRTGDIKPAVSSEESNTKIKKK